MSTEISELFAPEGVLARALPGYRFRPEQAAMAEAVARALALGESLLVEAGTGTGKTFAYLVPAMLSGRRVILSTGTRTLQDQLFRRDLPLLARALGRPMQVALLKGRANYLCRHRLDLASRQIALSGLERWAASTKSGDLSEFEGLPEHSPIGPLITSTRENCLGQECPRHADCHVLEARRQAQDADLVVVNHHLLLADLALKEGGFGDLLPEADALILDEAHQVPDIAAQFFGQIWSARQIETLRRDVLAALEAAAVPAPPLIAAFEAIDARLKALRATLPGVAARLDWAQLSDAFLDELSDLERALGEIGTQLEGLGAGPGVANGARRAQACAATLAALRANSDEAGVRWVEVGAAGLVLQFTPFEVAERLRERIEATGSTWIFTSATLALAGDFSHFATRIGLPEARTLAIDSPFDFRAQARIFLPPRMPEPQSPRYAAAFIEACAPLLEVSGGRAFLLYTSHRALAEGVECLRRRFPQPPFPVLVQGEAPRETLLARFRQLGNAVLLATGSFWEGVDVKGEALSIVAIDKLPFAAPDDPLLAARLEGIRRRGGNGFLEQQLPRAVLALKQGVGRLIRDVEDFGVIVIGDPRLQSKSYGRAFLAALPPSPVLTEVSQAVRFLGERFAAGEPRAASYAG